MKNRTKSRDYLVQLMYSIEITEDTPELILKNFWKEYTEKEFEIINFTEKLFKSSVKDKDKNDDVIKQFLTESWPFERIGLIEKSILRVSIEELFNGKAPVYAIISDYVSFAKKYGDEKSASFIKGILENIRIRFEIKRGYDEKRRNIKD